MAVINWNGASNLNLKDLGQTFDFRSDVLQISDPSLQANQFDLVENGTDLAIVKSRDATGAPLPAADVTYAYIPNMLVRQVGGTDALLHLDHDAVRIEAIGIGHPVSAQIDRPVSAR